MKAELAAKRMTTKKSRPGRFASLARSERGLTLIELLVAMTMLTVVVGGATMLITNVLRDQPKLSDRSLQIGLTRNALERMVRELRQGVAIDSSSASQVAFRTYVHSTCAGATSSTAVLCRVTYGCSAGTCTRTLSNPDGSGAGAAKTVIQGINNSTSVFTYTGSPPTYVGIKFALPTKDGRGTLTLQDGASLRNATLGL